MWRTRERWGGSHWSKTTFPIFKESGCCNNSCWLKTTFPICKESGCCQNLTEKGTGIGITGEGVWNLKYSGNPHNVQNGGWKQFTIASRRCVSAFHELATPKAGFFYVVFKPAGFFFCWFSLLSFLSIYSALLWFIIFHFVFDSNCNWLH